MVARRRQPAAFGWTGYLAAHGTSNPHGYIYGQMPTGDPSGGPANNDTLHEVLSRTCPTRTVRRCSAVRRSRTSTQSDARAQRREIDVERVDVRRLLGAARVGRGPAGTCVRSFPTQS